MIISFSNQKGGVGKSSLCILYANYLSMLGKKVHVIDADKQKTLCSARERDLTKYKDQHPCFEIEYLNMELSSSTIQTLRNDWDKNNCHYLVDLPGNLSMQHILICSISDWVIVPFQYEEFSIESTGSYASSLKDLGTKGCVYKGNAIFVPNMVDVRFGTAADRKSWEDWDRKIDAHSDRSPRVPDRACLKRINTLMLSELEMRCVESCFDYLTKKIFTNENMSRK